MEGEFALVDPGDDGLNADRSDLYLRRHIPIINRI